MGLQIASEEITSILSFHLVPQAHRVAHSVPAGLVSQLVVEGPWTLDIWKAWLGTLSMPPSTKRVYETVQRRYLAHCTESGSSPFPLTEAQLCTYVAHLMEEGLQHATIKGYLSAIRRARRSLGVWGTHLWPHGLC